MLQWETEAGGGGAGGFAGNVSRAEAPVGTEFPEKGEVGKQTPSVTREGLMQGGGEFQKGCGWRARPSLLPSFHGRKPARVSSEAKRCVAGRRAGVSGFSGTRAVRRTEGGCSLSPALALASARRLPDGQAW